MVHHRTLTYTNCDDDLQLPVKSWMLSNSHIYIITYFDDVIRNEEVHTSCQPEFLTEKQSHFQGKSFNSLKISNS